MFVESEFVKSVTFIVGNGQDGAAETDIIAAGLEVAAIIV